jgi:hypothetical protein
MAVIFGMTDKEREKINLLFENVHFITSNNDKVAVILKGIGNFHITPEEHMSKPSYVSGLPYAYQYFKNKGKELDFSDLVNMKVSDPSYLPEFARNGLIKILENEKLNAVYLGLKGEEYLGNDKELLILYESSKAFGNKSSNDLIEIQKQFDYSLLDGGFIRKFNDFFGKNYLDSNEHLKIEFQNQLFKSIREKSFTTSIDYKFDVSSGFRGNEYIRALQGWGKYKVE